MPVAWPQPQRRRNEAEHAQRPEPRFQQVRQPTAWRTRPPQRMGRRQQPRAQLPLRTAGGHPQAHLAQLFQAAAERRPRPPQRVLPPPLTTARRARLRRRQLPPQLGRQARQGLARRGRAQFPARIAPAVLLAQPAPQCRPRQLPTLQLAAQPVHRLRLQDAQPYPHCSRSTSTVAPVLTVIER